MEIYRSRFLPSEQLFKDSRITKTSEVRPLLTILDRWDKMATGLRTLHLSLGAVAIFFSLLAAVQIGFIQDVYAKVFAFLAAVTIAIMTGFNLTDKANNTRTAWRELNAGVMQFNAEHITAPELIDIYRQQEATIGGVMFSR